VRTGMGYERFLRDFKNEFNCIMGTHWVKSHPAVGLAFRRHMDSAAATDDLIQRAQAFCDQYRGRGEEKPLERTIVLGHFRKRERLIRTLSQLIRTLSHQRRTAASASLMPTSLEAQIDLVIEASRDGDDRFFRTVQLVLGDYKIPGITEMWAFQDPDNPGIPFNAGARSILPRLALPGNPDPDGHVYLAFRPSAVTAVKEPTVFDAGMACLLTWKEGGATAPAPPLMSLPEYIVSPISYRELRRPFDIIERM
jgi:hypothetical protein